MHTLNTILLHSEPPGHRKKELRTKHMFPFENWTEDLGSERLIGAALDRLTRRCNILETKGESYRLQDAKRRLKGPVQHFPVAPPGPQPIQIPSSSRSHPVRSPIPRAAIFPQKAPPFSTGLNSLIFGKREQITFVRVPTIEMHVAIFMKCTLRSSTG